MKFKMLLLSLLLASVVYAQNAKVLPLSDKDAAEAKSLHDQKVALEARTKHFDEHIKGEYLTDRIKYPSTACLTFDGSKCTPPKPTKEQEEQSWDSKIRDGWQNGFEYSEDYRYIVPASAKIPASPCWNSNCFLAGPFTNNVVPNIAY